jgi:hypothetical protein
MGASPVRAQTGGTVVVGQVNFASLIADSGETSAPHTLTVPRVTKFANCGASIWQGDTSAFFLTSTSRYIRGRLTCSYSATFTATSFGTHSADFGIEPYCHALPCPTAYVLKLAGRDVQPAPGKLSAKPATLNFGRALLGGDGAFKKISVVNPTAAAIYVDAISSSNPDFVAAQNCTNNIDAHSSCWIAVGFRPSSLGKKSGQITIAAEQGASPRIIKVSGVGVASLPSRGPKSPRCDKGLCGTVESGTSKRIAGAAVTLYAVGTAYQTGASILASIVTDAKGHFTLPAFTCPAGDSETYITAIGGDAGNNSAIGLIAALGPCGKFDTSTRVIINELTTAATELALAQFTDSSGRNVGAPASNARGLQIGYDSFANLADVDLRNSRISGKISGFLTKPLCDWNSGVTNDGARARLNTLADILATCVASDGPASLACGELFADSGAPNTETTLAIAHAVASNPKNNVGPIFAVLTQPSIAPFQPSLTTAPDGWELALNFSALFAGLNFPRGIALDAAGNVWVASTNTDSVSELPAGDYSCGALTLVPSGAELYSPFQVALDNAGNVWVANYYDSDSISELPAGNLLAGAVNFNAANTPGAAFGSLEEITLDAAGNAWAGLAPSGVSELPVGNYGPGATNFDSGNSVYRLTFDPFGNIWADSYKGVIELPKGNYAQATAHPISALKYPFIKRW